MYVCEQKCFSPLCSVPLSVGFLCAASSLELAAAQKSTGVFIACRGKGEPGWRSSEQQLTGCAEEGFAEGAGVPASICILGCVLAVRQQLWPQGLNADLAWGCHVALTSPLVYLAKYSHPAPTASVCLSVMFHAVLRSSGTGGSFPPRKGGGNEVVMEAKRQKCTRERNWQSSLVAVLCFSSFISMQVKEMAALSRP